MRGSTARAASFSRDEPPAIDENVACAFVNTCGKIQNYWPSKSKAELTGRSYRRKRNVAKIFLVFCLLHDLEQLKIGPSVITD
jgi:hypothetical protein